MMKSWLAWVQILGFTLPSAHGEGRVLFANRSGSSVNWPVSVWGHSLASGPDFKAQLMAGRSASTMSLVGSPVPFRSDVGIGYLDMKMDPAKLVRTVPTVGDVPGGKTFVRVVAWRVSFGSTYEDVLTRRRCGSYWEAGESEVVEMDTGAPDESEPPALMSAIRPFDISGPLSVEWDKFYFPHQTNGGLSVLYYANVGVLNGRHVLEWSTNLMDWQDSTAFTNEFMLELVMTNDFPAKFYRMRRRCE